MTKKKPIDTCTHTSMKCGTKCELQECVEHKNIRTYKDKLCTGKRKIRLK